MIRQNKKDKAKKEEDDIDKYLDQEYKDRINQYCTLLEEDNQAALKELNNANSKPALAFNSLQLQLSSNSDSDSVTCKHFTHWLKFKPEL